MNYYKTFNSKESQDVSLEQVAVIIGHDEELKKSTLLLTSSLRLPKIFIE